MLSSFFCTWQHKNTQKKQQKTTRHTNNSNKKHEDAIEAVINNGKVQERLIGQGREGIGVCAEYIPQVLLDILEGWFSTLRFHMSATENWTISSDIGRANLQTWFPRNHVDNI